VRRANTALVAKASRPRRGRPERESNCHRHCAYSVFFIGGSFDFAPFGAFARDFACGLSPRQRELTGTPRLPLRSRPQTGSSFGGIEKTMSRLPSTDPPEPRLLLPSGG